MAYEALNNLGCSGRRVIVVVNDNARSYAPTVSRLVAGRDGDAARFFAALGFDYAGPVDGHDIPATEQALRTASAHPGPSVVHVLTRKGRGYRPAEDDAEKCLRSPVRRRLGRAAIAAPGHVHRRATGAAGPR
jgi:1-deoxy-D-xylulose-5-phosphate synthase